MKPKELLGQITLANQLTFLRLVATPFLILAILSGRFDMAVFIYGAAAITDLLDGLTARLFRQETPLGAYLDPAADKILCTATFFLLTDYPTLFQGIEMANRIPIWLTILTVSRDAFIVVVAVLLYVAYGTTRFPPSIWGKLTTGAESVCAGLFLLFNQLQRKHIVLDVIVWITLALILISGFDYLGRTVRWLRAEEPRARAD
jgi:cardiolipin synthase